MLEQYYGKEKSPSKYLMRYSYYEKIKEENDLKVNNIYNIISNKFIFKIIFI